MSANKGGTGLRLVNVPSWADAELVRESFEGCETLGDVSVLEGRGHVRMGTIELSSEETKRVLKAPARHLRCITPPAPKNVIETWRTEYENARNVAKVQEWADATMEAYDARERAIEEEKERQRNQGVDDDGFEVVVGGPKAFKMADTDGVEFVEVEGRKVAVKAASTETKEGFYRWQRRKRQADIEGLRERFEQDKKRLRAAAALKLSGSAK